MPETTSKTACNYELILQPGVYDGHKKSLIIRKKYISFRQHLILHDFYDDAS